MTDERIDNIELLSRYKNGEMRAKEFLVQNNMALVKSIAVRFSGRSAVFEDLVGIGTIGLLKAIEGFDENLGFAFSTYAFSLISGEIKRFLRDDGIIKISRKIIKNAALVMAAKEKYIREHGKEPKISELCKICSLSAEEITECIDASRPVCSISAPLREDESMTPADTASDEDIFSPLVDRLALNQTLCELCDFDRQLIFLRYYKSLTQIQTAKILGISQVSVSRNEKRILSYLRQKLVIKKQGGISLVVIHLLYSFTKVLLYADILLQIFRLHIQDLLLPSSPHIPQSPDRYICP